MLRSVWAVVRRRDKDLPVLRTARDSEKARKIRTCSASNNQHAGSRIGLQGRRRRGRMRAGERGPKDGGVTVLGRTSRGGLARDGMMVSRGGGVRELWPCAAPHLLPAAACSSPLLPRCPSCLSAHRQPQYWPRNRRSRVQLLPARRSSPADSAPIRGRISFAGPGGARPASVWLGTRFQPPAHVTLPTPSIFIQPARRNRHAT